MFWIFIIAIVLGIILFKLGVLAVLVTILAVSLKAAIFVIAAMGIFMIWLQHRKH